MKNVRSLEMIKQPTPRGYAADNERRPIQVPTRKIAGHFLSLIAGFASGISVHAVHAEEYNLYGRESLVGKMTTSENGRNRRIHYGYSNNGRGSSWDSEFAVNSDEHPIAIRTNGVNLLRIPFEEVLDNSADTLTWKSPVDQGQGSQLAFYVPWEPSPEHEAMLVRALLSSKQHKLSLLPAGEASVTKATTIRVTSNGEKKDVTLYLLNGLNLGPTPIWLDANKELFAKVLPSSASINAIVAGWDNVLPSLLAAQVDVLDQHDRELAKGLGEINHQPIAFRHVRVFDAPNKRMNENMQVVITGDRIVSVAEDTGIGIPKGAIAVDGRGKTLMPGLWDMHVHIQSNLDGQLNIINGITSARDMGNEMNAALSWRSAFASGSLIGPRLSLAGLVDGRTAQSNNASIKVTNQKELSDAIELFARNGYVELKVYSSFPPELVPSAIKLAHEHGLRIGGHVPAGMRMDDVVAQGFDDVSHLNFALLNFLGDDIQKSTNGLQRMLAPAKLGSGIDVTSPRVRESFNEISKRGIILDDTSIVLELLFTARAGEIPEYVKPFATRLPNRWLRGSMLGGLARTEEDFRAYGASYKNALKLLKVAYEQGIPLIPGTDGMAGFMLPHQLEIYVTAGLRPVDALHAATYAPAKMLCLDNDLGSINAGKLADLILVRGDPSKDISRIRDIETVMKGGVGYDPAKISESIGIRPRPH